MAELTGSVMVSINYRLRQLGCLTLPELPSGSVCALLAAPRPGACSSGPCYRAAPAPCCGPPTGPLPADLVAAAATLPVSGPAYGDGLLPVEPAAAIAPGAWNKVPVLIGSTRSEGRFFVALTQPRLTAGQYAQQIRAQYGARAEEVLARYPADGYPSPYLALSAVVTDPPSPAAPTGRPASSRPKCRPAPTSSTTRTRRPRTAPRFRRSLTVPQKALADRMKRHWGAFARTGRPDAPGQAAWRPVPVAGPYASLTLRPRRLPPPACRRPSPPTTSAGCGRRRPRPAPPPRDRLRRPRTPPDARRSGWSGRRRGRPGCPRRPPGRPRGPRPGRGR